MATPTGGRPVRRAVLTPRTPPPLVVAVVTGFLWLLGLFPLGLGLLAIIEASLVPTYFVLRVLLQVAAGLVLLVAAAALAWVGAANASGRPWAWFAVAAGAVVFGVVTAVLAVALIALFATDSAVLGDEMAYALIVAGASVVGAGLAWIVRSYRQGPVRRFFGQPG